MSYDEPSTTVNTGNSQRIDNVKQPVIKLVHDIVGMSIIARYEHDNKELNQNAYKELVDTESDALLKYLTSMTTQKMYQLKKDLIYNKVDGKYSISASEFTETSAFLKEAASDESDISVLKASAKDAIAEMKNIINSHEFKANNLSCENGDRYNSFSSKTSTADLTVVAPTISSNDVSRI